MANADMIVALTQDALNTASASIYKSAYPKLFTGTFPYTSQNPPISLTVLWDVKQAPVLDLSPSAAARAAVDDYFQHHLQAIAPNGVNAHALAAAMLIPRPNFSARLPEIVLTIKTAGQADASLTLKDVTAYCYVQVANGQVTLTPVQLTADHDPDPLRDLLIQKFLLPELLSLLTTHLSGIVIPRLSIEGLQFSVPSLSIDQGHIVAAANLAPKGAPAPLTGVNWTNARYSALLSQDALQAAIAFGLSQVRPSLHDSDRQTTAGFGYYWGYNCTPGNPRVALVNGTQLDITLPLSASVWGGGIVPLIGDIGVDYAASVVPDPEFVCAPAIVGNQVHFNVMTVNTVVVILTPQGSVSEAILGWMLDGIVNAVTVSLSATFTTFVRSIPIPPVTIPTLSPVVAGVTFNIAPANLALSSVNGMLAVGGDLAVTVRAPVPAPVAAGSGR